MIGPSRRIVIIGGGLSGLSAAFYVRKYYKEAGVRPDIIVLEKDRKLGGRIETLHRDGFIIDKGPDSFQASETVMCDLVKELELDHELIMNNPKAKNQYILQRDKLYPLPDGLVLGVPTELKPFLKSGLISFKGKVRAMLDLFLPSRYRNEDEALGHLIERRLGTELMENLTAPFLTGLYAGDIRSISLQATFPQFAEAARKQRSLIRGVTPEDRSLLTFKKGLQSLAHGLIYELHDVELRTEAVVASLQATDCSSARYLLELDNGEQLFADDVFITTPNAASADLLRSHVDVTALEEVHYISVANLVMAYNKQDVEFDAEGSIILIPRKEGRNITSCTWTSSEWPHTSPEDKVLLRCYVGRSGDEQNVYLPDEALEELVLKDLREIVGITVKPIFTEITRLKHSMPQYPVGHLNSLAKFHKELEAALPGVYVFGAGNEGTAMPACIKQAKATALSAAKQLVI